MTACSHTSIPRSGFTALQTCWTVSEPDALCPFATSGASTLLQTAFDEVFCNVHAVGVVCRLTTFILDNALHSRVVLDAVSRDAALQRAQEAPAVHPPELVRCTLALVQHNRPENRAVLIAQLYPVASNAVCQTCTTISECMSHYLKLIDGAGVMIAQLIRLTLYAHDIAHQERRQAGEEFTAGPTLTSIIAWRLSQEQR